MSQPVSLRSLSVKDQVPIPGIPCDYFVHKGALAQVFLEYFSFPLSILVHRAHLITQNLRNGQHRQI